MKKRLLRNERLAVKSEIEPLEIYQMLHIPLKYYEQHMMHFKLSAEEMFCDCIEVLDYIKVHTAQQTKQYIRGLYLSLFCDYRDLAGDKVPDSEVQTATAAVIYSLVMLLSLSDDMIHTNLIAELLAQFANNQINAGLLQQQFTNAFYRINAEQTKKAYTDYMLSDFRLSEQLTTTVENVVQALPVSTNTSGTSIDDRFTQKQVVIFIVEALNIALTEINLVALACFIEKLTGYKGVRPILVNLKNGKTEYTHSDAEKVAASLKEIKPELANSIVNGIYE